MLLIVTERGDLTADFLILELEARGADFVRFNTEDYPTAVGIDWGPEGAELSIGGTDIDLGDIGAVWYRRPRPPQLPADYSTEEATWAAREAHEALHGVWRTLAARWVNHPDANRRAECKPEQLRVAAGLGLEIPATLVTNRPDRLSEFLEVHPAAICKPLLDGVVPQGDDQRLFFTSKIEAERLDAEALGPEPYLFQGLVEKAFDVRVTVIGEEVFAVEIESQTAAETMIDWRRGAERGLPHRPLELPEEIEAGCLALCRHYDLEFGTIDLALGPDGAWTFFEINPNGQWAWLEQATGLPLRARLADLLLGARVR
jgi:glutathione synthase/RimK-type ligase-like ATP-grasp enzyme